MKLAEFTCIAYGTEFNCVGTESLEKCSGYCRISEYVEVEFPRIPDFELIIDKVKALDARIEQIKTEATNTINSIQQKRSELLAIGM